MMKSFLQVSSDLSRNKKNSFTQIPVQCVRILHTFAVAMQYTIQHFKRLFGASQLKFVLS